MSDDIDFKPFVENVVARSSIQAFSSLPETLTKERAANALERDEFACRECGSEGFNRGDAELVLTYETVPRRLGSDEDAAKVENLKTVCAGCVSEEKDVEPLLSVQPSKSQSEKLADAVSGLSKFAANTDGWGFVRSQFKSVVVLYLFAVIIGGVAGYITERGVFWGMEFVGSVPVEAFMWLPSNYPLVGFVAYVCLVYPVLFILFEHSAFEKFRPRHGSKGLLVWLVALLGVEVALLPVYLNDYGFEVPQVVDIQPEYGVLSVGGLGFLLAGWKLRSVLKSLAYVDWTKTMLEAYLKADLNEYERRQLEPSDLEGMNYFPLGWLFLGRVSVYAQLYALFLYDGHAYAEVGMLSLPFVVGVAYLGWRWYQFRTIPQLSYNGRGVEDVSDDDDDDGGRDDGFESDEDDESAESVSAEEAVEMLPDEDEFEGEFEPSETDDVSEHHEGEDDLDDEWGSEGDDEWGM